MPDFVTSREIVIAAPPATIHPILNDFRQWSGWSPWEELDPQLQRTFSGPETGVGSHYAWVGNNKVGQGSMEITESTPERIAFDLEFLKPFKASNKGVLELRPEGDGTRVVWSMSGQRNVVLALMGKLFMDKVIGKDFEKGLVRLKALAEA